MGAARGWKLHGVLLFADKCWLTAMSPAKLKCMARAWTELLEKAGLRIAWEEAVCSSAPDSLEATITVSDTVITRRTGEHGFKALGAWITFDGHFVKEIAEREVIAWRSFYAIRNLLCDNKVALRHRLRRLSSCVASSMYWCSGSWILTVTMHSPAGNPRHDVETNDKRTLAPHWNT